MIRLIATTIAFILCAVFATAQNSDTKENEKSAGIVERKKGVKQKKERTITLYGHVKNSFTKVGVPDTKITLMAEDSTVIDTVRVNKPRQNAGYKYDAMYRFKIPAQKARYIIKAEHPDYEDCYVDYDIKYVARNTYFDVPWHYMKRRDPQQDLHRMLDEVSVTATKVRIAYKGDTVVFNADAFNVPDGSMLDELIRQLPGVVLKDNGEIYVNGQKIDYLTLNGKDFFKGENKVMLDNLPYYMVDDIQVFNKSTERSEYLGREVEKKDFVMDVRLKKEYNTGYNANVEGAKGLENEYLARLFGMRYTDNSRITLMGNANNITEMGMPGHDSDWNPTTIQNIGEVETSRGRFDLYIDDKEKRFSENLRANLLYNERKDEVRSATEYFLSSGNSFSRSTSLSNFDELDFSVDNEFKLKKPFMFTQSNSFSFYKSKNDGMSRGATFNSDPSSFGSTVEVLDSVFSLDSNSALRNIAVNRAMGQSKSDTKDFKFSNTSVFDYKFATGDDIWVRFLFNYQKNDADTYNQSRYDYFNSDTESDDQNVYNNSGNKNFDYETKVEYTIHWLNKWNLAMNGGYSYKYKEEISDRYRLDSLDGWRTSGAHRLGELPSTPDSLLISLDRNNSYNYTYRRKSGFIGVRPHLYKEWDGKSLFINVDTWVSFIREDMDYHKKTGSYSKGLSNTFVTNNSFIRYTTDNYKNRYSLSFSAQTSSPDLKSMIETIDDSNPLAVYLGNPNLKNSTVYLLYIAVSRRKQEINQEIAFNIGGTIRDNLVYSGYTYDSSTGKYTYKPENVNGNWSTWLYFVFNRALDKNKLWGISSSTRLDYSNKVSLSSVAGAESSTKITTKTIAPQEELKLTYKKGKLGLELVSSLFWASATNNGYNIDNINAFTFDYGVGCQYTLPWKLNFATTLKMFSRRGFSESNMNTDNLIWNASIGRTFCNGKLSVRLVGYDLLGEISRISYSLSSESIVESWRNSLSSYGMLYISYKFNANPKRR